MKVAVTEFREYPQSVREALDGLDAGAVLAAQERIVIKPNLVNDSPPPITTPVECVEALLDYCREHSNGDIVIAEGTGNCDTSRAFDALGYTEMAARRNVELIDLDQQETTELSNASFKYLKRFPLPRCLLDCFLISVPVLKAHSMSDVTLSMKNLIGIAPASVYRGGAYRKSKLHGRNNTELHQYILELNQYRKPDLGLIDATIGMAEAHLWGPHCDPPVNKLLASYDPVALDAKGAQLLGFDWRTINHIRDARGIIGKGPEE